MRTVIHNRDIMALLVEQVQAEAKAAAQRSAARRDARQRRPKLDPGCFKKSGPITVASDSVCDTRA
jgi:hypothetical protein